METRKKLIFVAMILLSCLYCQAQEEAVSMLDGDPVWVYQQKVWFRIKNAPEGAMMMKLMVIKQELSFLFCDTG